MIKKLLNEFKKINPQVYERLIELRGYALEDEDEPGDIPEVSLKAFLLFCKTFKFDFNEVSITLTPDNNIYIERRIKGQKILNLCFNKHGSEYLGKIIGCYIDFVQPTKKSR